MLSKLLDDPYWDELDQLLQLIEEPKTSSYGFESIFVKVIMDTYVLVFFESIAPERAIGFRIGMSDAKKYVLHKIDTNGYGFLKDYWIEKISLKARLYDLERGKDFIDFIKEVKNENNIQKIAALYFDLENTYESIRDLGIVL